MKKKTYFNKSLYKEGFRILLPYGVLLLGLLLVASIFFNYISLASNTWYFDFDSVCFYNIEAFIQFLAVMFFVSTFFIAPILTLRIFQFLTSRTGSDFFHSIPHKKECLCLSFAASAFTWVAICAFVPSLLSAVTFSIKTASVLPFLLLIKAFLHILCASLLVISTICIACAITGTIFTNIVVSVLVLLFPRFFIYACRYILSGMTGGFLPGNSFLTGTRCNLAAQSILGIGNCKSYLFQMAPLIYTFLLSIAYFVIAVILHRLRESETAMKPAFSKKFNALVCILLGTGTSLIPIWLFIKENNDTSYSKYLIVTILYVCIIVAMGIYQIIANRQFKAILQALPHIGIVAIINVVMILGLFGGKELILDNTPDASDIQSVRFLFGTDDSYDTLHYFPDIATPFAPGKPTVQIQNNTPYLLDDLEAYSTSDDTVCTIVANSLKEASMIDQYAADDDDTYNNLLVCVKTKYQTITRYVNMSNEDVKTIEKRLQEEKEFCDIFNWMPDASSPNIALSLTCSVPNIKQDDILKLYETMKEEVSTLGIKEVQNALYGSNAHSCELLLETFSDGSYKQCYLPITPALPKTFDLFTSLVNSLSTDTVETLYDYVKTHIYSSCDITYFAYDHNAEFQNDLCDVINIDSELLQQESVQKLFNLLIANENNPIDFSKPDCYVINISLYSDDSYENNSFCKQKLIQIDKNVVAPILQEINKFILDREENGY